MDYMEITNRQETILNALVKEYISAAEPVSSKLLKRRAGLDVCEATIRNELQELTETGFIEQPHTSAGRVPTEKAYRYFVDKIFADFSESENVFSGFIAKEIEKTKKQIEDELKLAEKLTESLTHVSATFSFSNMPEKDTLFQILIKLGPSRASSDKNIGLINSLLKELENF